MLKVVYNPAYSSYDLGRDHPFSPLRVDMVLDLLKELGHPLEFHQSRAATREELLQVHEEAYVDAVAAFGRGEDHGDPTLFGLGTPDNPIFPAMDEAARLLCGGSMEAARLVADGVCPKVLHLGGGLHHAKRGRASGFCVYNDLALAITELTRRGLFVAYLDVDVHHGDGVQEIFYESDRVLTVSLHESGQYLFPGSGYIHELGAGMGRGLKVNVPLEPFTEDDSYLESFEEVVPEVLRWYRPGVLFVQAGADAHYQDPLADLTLTTRGYERLFRRIAAFADEFAGGRLVVTLGGGYSMHATPRVWTLLCLILQGLEIPSSLPAAWRERWEQKLGAPLPEGLHDPDPAFEAIPRREEITRHNRHTVERLLDGARRYWI